MDKKSQLGLLLYSIAIIMGVAYLVVKKMKWAYYLVLIFLVAPAFYSLGYALGKKEKEYERINT